MSFRCERCGKAQPPRTRPHRLVVATRKVTIGHGYDKKVITQIAKEENRCDVCAVGWIHVTQDGVEKMFAAGEFTFGDGLKAGGFSAMWSAEAAEVFTFKQQEGPCVGSQGTKLVPRES